MKHILLMLSALTLVLSLSADETPQTDATTSEFPLIQPISIEEAPIPEAVESAPLDSDSDGILDRNDKCPNTKKGEEVDADGCLIKHDSDKDGVPDEDDNCPNTPEGTTVDTKGCELDSDDDGIVDSKDQCPDTSKDFVVDGYGCPQTATLKVNFGPNKYNVSEDLIEQLETFAMFLKENKGYSVIIYGYTDDIGKAEDNKLLSQRRANAVKEALTRYGISTTRLTSIGKGELDPIADNTTDEGRAQNRRIEVELLQ